MAQNEERMQAPAAGGDLAGKLGVVGWGLFIIWIGIVFLASLEAWVALLGVGLITLGVQAARLGFGLALEGFWAIVGLLFVLGAIWDLLGTTVPLLPILLIAGGVGLVFSIFKRQRA